MFAQSARDVSLVGAVVQCIAKKANGAENDTYFDTDTRLGNSDGVFAWGGTNWSITARKQQINESGILSAELRNCKGQWVAASIDLNEHLSNDNGNLVYL
eukprot:TRINITY_DN4764_c0_g1_i1.p1 TRINITY_DN4764_c0_g1~~TRINITY_DN4764_c0_g1_i1.p1  ORF type:complete len:100 (+),score=20.09 TRINITY_DN4764_c0_g1_i1:348-647(+)